MLVIIFAPLAGKFYGEPAVSSLVSSMSAVLLVQALGAQHQAILARRMAVRKIVQIDTGAACGGLLCSVIWAFFMPSFWAIYVGTLTTAILSTSSYWCVLRWLPGAPRYQSSIREITQFGAGLTAFHMFNFVSRTLDNILIGRAWGSEALGLYDRAYKLLLLPVGQVIVPLSRVMVPALSRLVGDPVRYQKLYISVGAIVIIATAPGIAAAIAFANVLVPFTLGSNWAGSIPIFQALGFAGLLQTLNSQCGWLFVSQGRSTEYMYLGMFIAVTASAAFF